MEFINVIPTLLTSVGGFVVALSIALLIKKLGAFIEKIEL
jgi:hypothetical protein